MKFPKKWNKDYQYKTNDEILVLGEMDFSFSLAIHSKFPNCSMLSTAHYQSIHHIPSQCRNIAKANINKLRALGCEIRFNVNAENVSCTGEKFDKVIFTFPRTMSKKMMGYRENLQQPFIKRVMNKLGMFILLRSNLIQILIII